LQHEEKGPCLVKMQSQHSSFVSCELIFVTLYPTFEKERRVTTDPK
jgi:hypothetical protein